MSLVRDKLHAGAGLPARVLMTTDAVGGVWEYSLELARGLARAGVEIVLAALGPPPDNAQSAAARAISGLTLHQHEGRLEWMDDAEADVRDAGRFLVALAAAEHVDLVHLGGYAHAAAGFTVPTVVVAHSCVLSWWRAVKVEPAPARLSGYRERVLKGLAAASTVVAPTRAMLSELELLYGARRSAEVIANGRDPRTFRLEREKQPFVLSAGRLWDDAKNTAALARVAGRLAWPVRVAGAIRPGDGPDRPRFADEVVCLGRLPPRALAEHYARAGIYALPALYEPFGLTALEAGLAGCALVLGDIPSLRELWHDAALFVDPRDDDALADAIGALIEDETLRGRMADRARERAEHYPATRMVEGYLACYRRLLAGARRAEALACAS